MYRACPITRTKGIHGGDYTSGKVFYEHVNADTVEGGRGIIIYILNGPTEKQFANSTLWEWAGYDPMGNYYLLKTFAPSGCFHAR